MTQGTSSSSYRKLKVSASELNTRRRSTMSRVPAPAAETMSPKASSHESSSPNKSAHNTVIEHVLSRLKELGITKVFGVAGDFAFAIEAFPGIEWVGCWNELNAAYAADGYGRIHGIAASTQLMGWVN
jgi:hypothetical protein